MYALDFSDKAYAIFKKLGRKNPGLVREAYKKIRQIQENPHRFKYLHANMRGLFRAHVAGSFVIVFEIDEAGKAVVIRDFDHHDKIYRT
ncbi:MAG: type II toxin-antitoxin system RelE/ParE family toxin [Candidatus Micrarchaeota archaeon]